MKQIQVLVTGMAQVSTSGINLTEAMNLARKARRIRLKVMEGALSVENQLDTVILHYFFGASHERRGAFESIVPKLRLVLVCRKTQTHHSHH
jgi:hypothetical protein